MRVDAAWLSGLLGLVLVTYSTLNLGGVRFALSARREVWAGPALGAVNGVLTGMTGTFLVPGILFLQAIGLSRDTLVQALGMLFTLSTVALALALYGNGLLHVSLGSLSRRRPGSGGHRHGSRATHPQAPLRGKVPPYPLHRPAAVGRIHRHALGARLGVNPIPCGGGSYALE